MLADSFAVSGGAGGAWNRDDVILFTPKAGSPLHRIAASGGTSVPVTKLDMEYGEDTHRFPFFLPDGQHFLYLAAGSTAGGPNEARGVFVGSLDPSELPGEPLCFGHTLDDQIGGQLAAGFVLTGFFEDRDPGHPLAKYLPTFIATRAVRGL